MEPELSVPEGTSSGVGSQLQHDTARCLQKTIMHVHTYVRSSLYSIYCTGQMQTNWGGGAHHWKLHHFYRDIVGNATYVQEYVII